MYSSSTKFWTSRRERGPPSYRETTLKLLGQVKSLFKSLHIRVWRIQSVPSSWHNWHPQTLQNLQEGRWPVKVVGLLFKVVGQKSKWPTGRIGGLHTESKPMAWWETRKGGPKTKETSFLTRKLAGEKKSSLQGEKLVSHPHTTSNQGKQGLYQKQTKTDARREFGRQSTRPGASKTSCWAPKVVHDHKSSLLDHSVPLGRGSKVWFKNQAKRRTLSGPETRRTSKGSENRKLVSK